MTRPTGGYVEQGAEAHAKGVAYERCPYPNGILKSVEWALGWQESRLDFAEDGSERDDAQVEISSLKGDRRRLLQAAQKLLPSAPRAATAVKIPLSRWPGNCYGIAEALLKSGVLKKLEKDHGKAKALYGVYHGTTGKHFQDRAETHHGWIEFPDTGLVVDPTRWVFDQTDPAIVATTAGDAYDLAGSRLRARFAPTEVPRFDGKQRTFVWKSDKPADSFLRSLLDLGRKWNGMLSLNQMFWLANLPVDRLHPHAESVYRFFEEVGCLGMVPLDNRQYVGFTPSTGKPGP